MTIDQEALETLASAWDDCKQTQNVSVATLTHWGMRVLTLDGGEYAVGTEEEARAAAEEYIKDSLWAFRPEFLAHYATGSMLPHWIKEIIGDRCEDANCEVLDMVGDNIGTLIEDAIKSDGLGHFLSPYDGEAHTIVSPAGIPLVIARLQ